RAGDPGTPGAGPGPGRLLGEVVGTGSDVFNDCAHAASMVVDGQTAWRRMSAFPPPVLTGSGSKGLSQPCPGDAINHCRARQSTPGCPTKLTAAARAFKGRQ